MNGKTFITQRISEKNRKQSTAFLHVKLYNLRIQAVVIWRVNFKIPQKSVRTLFQHFFCIAIRMTGVANASQTKIKLKKIRIALWQSTSGTVLYKTGSLEQVSQDMCLVCGIFFFWVTEKEIYRYLKVQCHEIFRFWFFSSISFPPTPEYPIRTVSIFFENSRRYSQLKVDHRCR